MTGDTNPWGAASARLRATLARTIGRWIEHPADRGLAGHRLAGLQQHRRHGAAVLLRERGAHLGQMGVQGEDVSLDGLRQIGGKLRHLPGIDRGRRLIGILLEKLDHERAEFLAGFELRCCELGQEKEQQLRRRLPRASGGEQPGAHRVDMGAGFPMTGLDTVAQVLQRLTEQEHAGRDEFLVRPLSAPFRQQQLDKARAASGLASSRREAASE